mmetsp:Transcript_60328/g.165724  ORF Transcript_60328/g.165724 Transcript_60328/m.165724 type:complete len:227 (-) Transcript_60328:15-695(-)
MTQMPTPIMKKIKPHISMMTGKSTSGPSMSVRIRKFSLVPTSSAAIIRSTPQKTAMKSAMVERIQELRIMKLAHLKVVGLLYSPSLSIFPSGVIMLRRKAALTVKTRADTRLMLLCSLISCSRIASGSPTPQVVQFIVQKLKQFRGDIIGAGYSNRSEYQLLGGTSLRASSEEKPIQSRIKVHLVGGVVVWRVWWCGRCGGVVVWRGWGGGRSSSRGSTKKKRAAG